MSLITPDYEKVKWIVSRNANGQAKFDVDRMPIHSAKNYLDDPMVYESYIRVMNKWKRGPKADLVFTNCDPELVKKLSPKQRDVLIDHWVFQLYVQAMHLIREKIES